MIRNQHLRTPSGYQRGKKGKKERKKENEQKKGLPLSLEKTLILKTR